MKINVRLKEEFIVELYDAVAREMGVDPSSVDKYDCTKISVSRERADCVENRYKREGGDWKLAFGMHWVCSGPKAIENLVGEEVEIEDGFIKMKGEE